MSYTSITFYQFYHRIYLKLNICIYVHIRFPQLTFALNIKITNLGMDNVIISTIFTQTVSMDTATKLKEKIFNTEKFKIDTKAKISTCIGVNIFLLRSLCISEVKEKFK